VIDNADCFADQWFETSISVNARFVRLTVTGDQAANKVQVREFEIFGTLSSTSSSQEKFSGSSALQTVTARVNREGRIEISGIRTPRNLSYALYTIQGRQIQILDVICTQNRVELKAVQMPRGNYIVGIRGKDKRESTVRVSW